MEGARKGWWGWIAGGAIALLGALGSAAVIATFACANWGMLCASKTVIGAQSLAAGGAADAGGGTVRFTRERQFLSSDCQTRVGFFDAQGRQIGPRDITYKHCELFWAELKNEIRPEEDGRTDHSIRQAFFYAERQTAGVLASIDEYYSRFFSKSYGDGEISIAKLDLTFFTIDEGIPVIRNYVWRCSGFDEEKEHNKAQVNLYGIALMDGGRKLVLDVSVICRTLYVNGVFFKDREGHTPYMDYYSGRVVYTLDENYNITKLGLQPRE